MKLHVFNAADGDCLLLESRDRRYMLIDGGRSGSFMDHTAQALADLAAAGRELDAICVSHIDADHITGVLKLLEFVVEDRVHQFQIQQGNDRHRAPKFTMPKVHNIWHNGFEQLLGIKLASQVSDTLQTTTRVLGAAEDLGPFMSAEAWALSERQSAELGLQALTVLGIPINGDAAAPPTLEIGGVEPDRAFGAMTITLLAPHAEDVEKLREEFEDWSENNRDVLDDLKEKARTRASRFTSSADALAEMQRLVEPAAEIALALNNRGKVTPENLASIMLHVQEGRHAMLLTGDGHGDDVIKGLEAQGLLQDDEPMHVSILKIPHHGSEFNIGFEERNGGIDSPFLRRITADHYVFCGDGSHHNPDKRIVQAVIDSRIGPDAVRAANPAANGRFKLWFTSHPQNVKSAADKKQMSEIRNYVLDRARRSDRIEHEFLEGSRFTIKAGSRA